MEKFNLLLAAGIKYANSIENGEPPLVMPEEGRSPEVDKLLGIK